MSQSQLLTLIGYGLLQLLLLIFFTRRASGRSQRKPRWLLMWGIVTVMFAASALFIVVVRSLIPDDSPRKADVLTIAAFAPFFLAIIPVGRSLWRPK
ncbi:MAG: hypothetical protein ACO1QR_17165 [Chthoniobacteraceae bacterium]